MRRLSTQISGVEKEKEEAPSLGGKKTGILSSGIGSPPGNDLGRKTGEGAMFGNGYRHENDIQGREINDLDDNPWVSASSISPATLRSRRHGRTSSRDFGYLHDEADSRSYASDGQRDSGAETRRRRRRSRSAVASGSISKHPLYVDMDDDGNEYGTMDRHIYRTHSETQPFNFHRGLSSPSDHRTRPSLGRAIGSLEGCTDKDPEESRGSERPSDLDVDVIVHKVLRTDTLAGIALKYNIPLAQLRKTNKLWTNDSIHLRQVLYIPLRDVSLSSPSSRILTSDSNTILNSGEQLETASLDFDYNTGPNAETDAQDTPIPTKDDIRKIPHSHLSFFPPSGTGASGPSMTTSVSTSIPNHNTRRTYPTSTTAGSSPSFPFTSLFQGLNNATQEIKSRLSLDSYSRHSSDPGDEGEIELTSVKKDRIRKLAGAGEDNGVSIVTSPSAPTFAPNTPTISSGRLQNHTEHFVDSSASTLLPSLSPSTPRKAVIRSIQLQPSPEMKIPTTSSMDPKYDIRMRHFIPGYQQQADIDSETE